VAIPWDDRSLHFDDGHPVVQAAYGGHPTYDDACRQRPRPYLKLFRNILTDWVTCGSGRYAFRYATTPVVDLSDASWACWPGHFGEATPKQLRDAARPKWDLRRYYAKNYKVPGPASPLRQAENKRVCDRGQRAAQCERARADVDALHARLVGGGAPRGAAPAANGRVAPGTGDPRVDLAAAELVVKRVCRAGPGPSASG
jgi:hypothetical protein